MLNVSNVSLIFRLVTFLVMHIIIIVIFTKCLIIQNPINKYECQSFFLLLSSCHDKIHWSIMSQRKIQYWVILIILVIFIENYSLLVSTACLLLLALASNNLVNKLYGQHHSHSQKLKDWFFVFRRKSIYLSIK